MTELRFADDSLRIGDSQSGVIRLNSNEARALARALEGIRVAGKGATPSTIVTDRTPVVVTPAEPSGVCLTRGRRTSITLTGRECRWIVKAYGC